MHQDDASAHLPALHRPEQQAVVPASSVPHGLPAVAQVVLSGVQVPPVHLPLQHEAELVQAWLSATQLGAVAQTPRAVSHWKLQQSVATAQELPGPMQFVIDDRHFRVAGSQELEQHWLFELQAAPATVQITLAPPVPPIPAAPPPPEIPPAPTVPPFPAGAGRPRDPTRAARAPAAGRTGHASNATIAGHAPIAGRARRARDSGPAVHASVARRAGRPSDSARAGRPGDSARAGRTGES